MPAGKAVVIAIVVVVIVVAVSVVLKGEFLGTPWAVLNPVPDNNCFIVGYPAGWKIGTFFLTYDDGSGQLRPREVKIDYLAEIDGGVFVFTKEPIQFGNYSCRMLLIRKWFLGRRVFREVKTSRAYLLRLE